MKMTKTNKNVRNVLQVQTGKEETQGHPIKHNQTKPGIKATQS
jgi:hypothetical protein